MIQRGNLHPILEFSAIVSGTSTEEVGCHSPLQLVCSDINVGLAWMLGGCNFFNYWAC